MVVYSNFIGLVYGYSFKLIKWKEGACFKKLEFDLLPLQLGREEYKLILNTIAKLNSKYTYSRVNF